MSIILSEAAAKQIKRIVAEQSLPETERGCAWASRRRLLGLQLHARFDRGAQGRDR